MIYSGSATFPQPTCQKPTIPARFCQTESSRSRLRVSRLMNFIGSCSRAGSRNNVDAGLFVAWLVTLLILYCSDMYHTTCPYTMIYLQKQRIEIYWNIGNKHYSNSVPAPQIIGTKQNQSPQHYNCPLGQTGSAQLLDEAAGWLRFIPYIQHLRLGANWAWIWNEPLLMAK